MGINVELAKRAKAIAEELAAKAGFSRSAWELFITEAYAQIREEDVGGAQGAAVVGERERIEQVVADARGVREALESGAAWAHIAISRSAMIEICRLAEAALADLPAQRERGS